MKPNSQAGAHKRHNPDSGNAAVTYVMAASFLALCILAALWFWRRNTPGSDVMPVDINRLQGDPIRPLVTKKTDFTAVSNRFSLESLTNLAQLASTNAAIAEVMGTDSPGLQKRKRAKPGSYPKRLMDLQLRLLREGKDPLAYDTNLLPAGFTITNLPAPQREGYRSLSFAALSGFDFQLRPDIVQGGTNGQALLQVPEEIRALNGEKAAISGFLLPTRMDDGLAVEFLLMRDQTLCCFGRVPRLNEWINVRATSQGVVPRMDVPITVCGQLHVVEKREGGTLIGLYEMDADQVLPVVK